MCDDHPPGSMTKACGICAAALDLVRPEVAKSWLAPVIVAKAAVARYAVRSDEKPPTLMFSESTLDLAVNTLTQGKFRNNSHFQELTRNYLRLPDTQHDKLVQDLCVEPFFKKLEKEPRFKPIFTVRKEMGDCLHMLRISQRPLFTATSVVDDFMEKVLKFGRQAGLVFAVEAPPRENLQVPRPVVDNLAVESSRNMLPQPEFKNIFEGVSGSISQDDYDTLTANARFNFDAMTAYRTSVMDHYLELFQCVKEHVNRIDDSLGFHFDLYSHVDASIRDFLRSRLVACLKPEFRKDVLTTSKKSSGKEAGLMGGKPLYPS